MHMWMHGRWDVFKMCLLASFQLRSNQSINVLNNGVICISDTTTGHFSFKKYISIHSIHFLSCINYQANRGVIMRIFARTQEYRCPLSQPEPIIRNSNKNIPFPRSRTTASHTLEKGEHKDNRDHYPYASERLNFRLISTASASDYTPLLDSSHDFDYFAYTL